MSFKKILSVIILFFYVQSGFAASMCVDFLEQNLNFSFLSISDIEQKLKQLTFVERVKHLELEKAKVSSELDSSPAWFDRALSKTARKETRRLKERLTFLTSELESLKAIEKTVEGFHVFDDTMDVKLTNRLLKSTVERRRLKYVNDRVSESKSTEEQNFLVSVSYFILFNEDVSFLTMPFSHWLTMNILYGREHESHFESLTFFIHNMNVPPSQSLQIETIKEVWTHSLDKLEPKELTSYASQGVDCGLMTAQDLVRWQRHCADPGHSAQNYNESNNFSDTFGSNSFSDSSSDSDGGGGGGGSSD